MRGESKYSLVAGGQRENRIELAKATVGSSVSEETSKNSHPRRCDARDDDDANWVEGGGGDADESHTTAAEIPVTPYRWHPDCQQKRSSLTSQSLHAV